MIKKLIKDFIKLFFNISRPIFIFEDNQLKFKINSDKFFINELQEFETKTRHDSYTIESYTIDTSSLHIEYIHLDEEVFWNDSSFKYFIDLIERKLRASYVKVYEERSFKNYTFSAIKFDNNILPIIHIHEQNKDVFIIDKNYELYENLYNSFDKKYEYTYEKTNNSRLKFDFNLVKENAYKNYFSLENSL